MVTIQIDGAKQVRKKLLEIARKMGDLPMKEAAFEVEKQAKMALTTGYTRAIRTGRLRGSTGVQELGPYRASIYPTVNYAYFVHEGTRYMRPRPFMTVAARNSLDTIKSIFGDFVKVTINR